MRVLIVDDDRSRRVSLVNHLVKKRIVEPEDIEEVEFADRAKELLSSSYYDFLILDVVLPKRSGGHPSERNGIALLGQLARSSRLKKPGKIIGLTAFLGDIATYRREFERFCFTVIEASPNSYKWRSQLSDALLYESGARLSESVSKTNSRVMTIHGIRTFGKWQQRLEAVVRKRIDGVPFHSYKYGLVSLASFFLPFLRRPEIDRLIGELTELFDRHEEDNFVIFAHSFGGYLVTYALREMIQLSQRVPVKTVVLCGSVLVCDFDWNVFKRMGIRVINDCADSDYVLWLSEAFVPGTGMAGRCGFYGFQDASMINRFFPGGHSSFFNGDDFMQTYWLPLLGDESVKAIDLRSKSLIKHEICDKGVQAIGSAKRWLLRGWGVPKQLES